MKVNICNLAAYKNKIYHAQKDCTAFFSNSSIDCALPGPNDAGIALETWKSRWPWYFKGWEIASVFCKYAGYGNQ